MMIEPGEAGPTLGAIQLQASVHRIRRVAVLHERRDQPVMAVAAIKYSDAIHSAGHVRARVEGFLAL